MTLVMHDPPPACPAGFAGTIGIEWPAGSEAGDEGIPGWRIAFYDAEGYVTTVSRMELHAEVAGFIWANLTVFTDAAGKPVLHMPDGHLPADVAEQVIADGEWRTGTFPFLVTSMRTAS